MSDPAKSTGGGFLKPTVATGALSPPTMAPLKLNSTGSATGNPRNKCRLKPGYSLMGWVRLGNSGEDLAGTKGRVTPVSCEELAKHNTKEDAWMALRGKVFNVTRYMDYHPGGVDELMRGVGRDATKLFDEVHAWVNYPQLLAKCYVGPLRNASTNGAPSSSPANGELNIFAKPPRSQQTAPAEVVPRFDWTQNTNKISLYVYTRQLCNPGLIVQRRSERAIDLRVQIEQRTHLFEFAFQHGLQWRPEKVRIAQETGKIEVVLAKQAPQLWTTYGEHKLTTLPMAAGTGLHPDELRYNYEVVGNASFNHDSYQLCLRGGVVRGSDDNCTNEMGAASRDTIMLLPVGHHVTISAPVNGEVVQRSYTPVDVRYIHSPHEAPHLANNMNLHFLIKDYAERGRLSAHLMQLRAGAVVQVSAPKGSFRPQRLAKHRRIAFLAAGSGLTPVLSLLPHLLERTTNRIEQLVLVYFNKTVEDIWCADQLHSLQARDERFKCLNILSQASESWRGQTGRISKELLAPLADKSSSELYATFVAVCGPSGFNECAKDILTELQFNADTMHIFQG